MPLLSDKDGNEADARIPRAPARSGQASELDIDARLGLGLGVECRTATAQLFLAGPLGGEQGPRGVRSTLCDSQHLVVRIDVLALLVLPALGGDCHAADAYREFRLFGQLDRKSVV